MGLQIIQEKVTPQQLRELLEEHQADEYVKLAVDLETSLVAGGGEWHADCEALLLEQDCNGNQIWGAGWLWKTQEVTFDSLINIRPTQGNRTLELQDPVLRQQIHAIVTQLFAGVQP
jgi:hypothetical protein